MKGCILTIKPSRLWASNKIFENWYFAIVNLNNYFDRHVCPSMFRSFVRPSQKFFLLKSPRNHPLTPEVDPRGWPRVAPGHAAPPEELARARRALSSNIYFQFLYPSHFSKTAIQGIYLVHLLCSNYDGKFKSVGCNKFTLFPILGVERSFPFPGKVATGKGPFLSQERLQLGKVSAILGKLQLGKVSVILGKERILSFPRKGVVCNWERFQ